MTAEKPKLIREINVELDYPISYAYKGDMLDGNFVLLKAPTGRQIVECAELKQAFFQAISSQTIRPETEDNNNDASLKDLTGDAIMALISMSTGAKLSTVLLSAKELFASGVAFIEGETKMTKPLIDELHPDDLEKLVGAYYLNFILASWLAKQQNDLLKNA